MMTEQEDKGHYVCYVPRNFQADALAVIETANAIIHEYEGKGMAITLRQLYYQFVARDAFPDDRRWSYVDGKWKRDPDGTPNAESNYDWLGDIINNGRLAGLVSWTAIEDRGRNLMGYQTFGSPQKSVKWLAKEHYRIDMWANQPFRPEVWVEKHALEGVVGSICNELRVDFFGVGGYNSQSEAWRGGRRMAARLSRGQTPIVFHLGDHDPSGIDMTRDNKDRLDLFCGHPVQVVRLALNMPQIERYRPPPNPAKVADSRFKNYRRQFGDQSWELDALEPTVIRELIRDAVVRIRDGKLWDEALLMEAQDKLDLEDMIENGGDDGEENE